jgi:hypothetical protein
VKVKKIDRKGLLDGIESDEKKLKHVQVIIISEIEVEEGRTIYYLDITDRRQKRPEIR